jgi:hypothetical protein
MTNPHVNRNWRGGSGRPAPSRPTPLQAPPPMGVPPLHPSRFPRHPPPGAPASLPQPTSNGGAAAAMMVLQIVRGCFSAAWGTFRALIRFMT